MLAYNFKSHMGLITFASTPTIQSGISHVLENFRRSVNDIEANGDTALWDALALASDQLVEYGKKYPQAKKRIICISDGEDTSSVSNKPQEICWRLRSQQIAVDKCVSWQGQQCRAAHFVLAHRIVRFPTNLSHERPHHL